MRLPAPLNQGMRLGRQSQEGNSNQVRSGPFSLVTKSRRVTGGLTCLLQNTYPLPQSCDSNSKEAPDGLGTPEVSSWESCRGWASFGQETCKRWAGLQIIAGSLSRACFLFLSFPCLPLPPSLLCWPPPFVEEWSLVLETLTLILGLLDYQLYLQETEQLWGV